jgi:hypothetical protein
MLKWLNPEIALGVLLATVLWTGVLGWQAAYAPTEREKQECYEAAKKSGHKTEECKTIWERTTSDPVALFTFGIFIFTAVLGISTMFLWSATKAAAVAGKVAAEHIPKVERAYLTGGGGLQTEPDHSISFHLDIQNYGKTPAKLTAYAVFFCERSKLPDLPEYMKPGFKPEPLVDDISPDAAKKVIRWYRNLQKEYTILAGKHVVYGRFWYNDIFGDEPQHVFSFILSVANKDGRGFGTHADVAEASPEYTRRT